MSNNHIQAKSFIKATPEAVLLLDLRERRETRLNVRSGTISPTALDLRSLL